MPYRISRAVSVTSLFGMFNMTKNELKILEFLSKGPMTMKVLKAVSHMSERMLRTHLDDLVGRNLVVKRVVEGERLKYEYSANPPEKIIGMVKNALNNLEKSRGRMKRHIVSGNL